MLSPIPVHSPQLSINRNHEYYSLFLELKKDFESNKTFKIPGLTLQKYSEMLGIHSYKVSACINHAGGVTFNDFINRYRVEEAKDVLANPDYNHFTAEAVGIDAGFKSKATFFPAFKKLEKITPAEYRKKSQGHL